MPDSDTGTLRDLIHFPIELTSSATGAPRSAPGAPAAAAWVPFGCEAPRQASAEAEPAATAA